MICTFRLCAFLDMYAFNVHKKFQKEMVKEAAAPTAALGMCCDTRLRLCLTPSQDTPRGGEGHRPGKPLTFHWLPPLAVSLSSLREGACSPWSTRGCICHGKEGAKACIHNVQELWLVHRWDTSGTLPERAEGTRVEFHSHIHNITLRCQSVILFP